MEGSKAIKAAEQLVKLKENEILEYVSAHTDIISPLLKMQQELYELRGNAVDIKMKQVPILMNIKGKNQLL